MESRKFLTNQGCNEKVTFNIVIKLLIFIISLKTIPRVTTTRVTVMVPFATETLTMGDTTTMVMARDTTGGVTISQ